MPLPPDGFALHVVESPVLTEAGFALHEPDTGSRTVMVTGSECFVLVKNPPMPPVTLQVAVYEVVWFGETETFPLAI